MALSIRTSFRSLLEGGSFDALKESETAVTERLARTRPVLAAWFGGVGLVLLIALMVLKPF